jgi:hypothetical protein
MSGGGLLKTIANAIAQKVALRTGEHLLREPVFDPVLGTEALAPLDVRKFAQIVAGFEAGDFYCRHLYNVDFFPSYLDHITEMTRRSVALGSGLLLEFGVATGTTLTSIANATERQVVGFDSFQGLPMDWRDGVRAGAFECVPPKLPGNATLRIGMIEETLPAFLTERALAEINFIHVDTDLYRPAKLILDLCSPRIRDAIIVFDEFFNFPGWRDHEFKALSEFQREKNATFDFRFVGLGGATAVSIQVTRKI